MFTVDVKQQCNNNNNNNSFEVREEGIINLEILLTASHNLGSAPVFVMRLSISEFSMNKCA